MCDDSGVSDVASSGSNSNGEDNTLFDSHMTVKDGSHDSGSDVVGTSSERWAHVSSFSDGYALTCTYTHSYMHAR